MKARPNSLYARLLQAQKPEDVEMERLDELMLFLQKGGSYEDAAGLCHEWGIHTSETAVHDFYSRHAFPWRLERAQAAAAATGNLPSFAQETKRLNAQAIFEAVSNPETDGKIHVAIRSLEIEQEKLDLAKRSAETRFKLETEKLTIAKRRVEILETKMAQAKSALEGLKAKGGLSKETREQIEEAARLL